MTIKHTNVLNVCLDNLLVKQLKNRSFICNALNCLNEENKRFTNDLSLFFIFSSFTFSLYYHIYIIKVEF